MRELTMQDMQMVVGAVGPALPAYSLRWSPLPVLCSGQNRVLELPCKVERVGKSHTQCWAVLEDC